MIQTTDVVTYDASLSVAGGPAISESSHFDAEAYEKIEAVIPKNAAPVTVNVQPSELSQLQGLIIVSDNYTDVSFTVDLGIDSHQLSGPLILIGAGNIALLGVSMLDLVFTNINAQTDANVTILVARTAVEPQA